MVGGDCERQTETVRFFDERAMGTEGLEPSVERRRWIERASQVSADRGSKADVEIIRVKDFDADNRCRGQ
ncbi:hypothetical protein GCM10027515_12620 [Schumannella luteola]